MLHLSIIFSSFQTWSSDIFGDSCGVSVLSVPIVLCIVISLIFVSFLRLRWECQRIPGPRGLPIFGNVFQLGNEVHKTLMKMAGQYGDVFQVSIASRKVVVLNGAKAIHQALAKQSVDFAGRADFPSMSMLDKTTGRCISFSTYSEKWRLLKKISETALRHFTVGGQRDAFEQIIMLEVESLIKFWEDSRSAKDMDIVVNPEKTLQLSSINVIRSLIFGERRKLDDPELIALLDLQSGFHDVFSTANTVDFMPWLLRLSPKLLANFHAYLKQFKETFVCTINRYLKNHKSGADGNIMDYILTLAEKVPEQTDFTPEFALSSAYDFMGAGVDGLPASVMWLIYYMVTYPDIQEKVHKELDTVLSGRGVRLGDHCRLPFTEAVIAEVLRISSVIALPIPHSTTRDTVLGGDYNLAIPKGTVVFVNYYSVHYDESLFLESQQFIPERFLRNDGLINSQMVSKLVAFGVGRRRCPGSDVARIEIFLYFATLMQRFQLSCPEGETLNPNRKTGLVARPTLGAIKLKHRRLDVRGSVTET